MYYEFSDCWCFLCSPISTSRDRVELKTRQNFLHTFFFAHTGHASDVSGVGASKVRVLIGRVSRDTTSRLFMCLSVLWRAQLAAVHVMPSSDSLSAFQLAQLVRIQLLLLSSHQTVLSTQRHQQQCLYSYVVLLEPQSRFIKQITWN